MSKIDFSTGLTSSSGVRAPIGARGQTCFPVEWNVPSRYAAVKVLGSGHDGLCYLAVDSGHIGDDAGGGGGAGEKVAVKILKPKRRRDITEPEIMQQLQHVNVVGLRCVYPLANSAICIVLDFCELGDLCDFVFQHEFLSEPTTRIIMRQLLAGLAYLHERKICHRDLKLDNVFLARGLLVKIGDFGAACRFEPGTKLTYRCGTTQYMAPELLRNAQYYGDRVDMWALGIILYVMLVGKFPYDGDVDMQLLWQIAKGIRYTPSQQATLSDDARALIAALLHSDPLRRATLADVRRHVWMIDGDCALATHDNDDESTSDAMMPFD